MAYDVAGAVAKYTQKLNTPKGGFDVNGYLLAHGIQPKPDLKTVEGLKAYASQQGFGKQAESIVDTTPRLSFMDRLTGALGAFNPAEALLTGTEKGAAQGALKYATGIAQGLGGAVTGVDYQGERRTFADVASEVGIENKIAKFGIGFVGDVLLDPTTYLGGAMVRGLTLGVKTGTELGLKGIGKIAPVAEAGLRLTGEGIKEATGRAFSLGYKSSEGALEDVLVELSKQDKAALGLATSNLNRLGVELTKEQSTELALALVAKRRAEFELGEVFRKQTIKQANDLFPELKVKDVVSAKRLLDTIEESTLKKIGGIRAKIEDIVKPFFAARKAAVASGKTLEGISQALQTTPAVKGFGRIDELNGIVSRLRTQLSELRKEMGVGAVAKAPVELGGAITKNEVVHTYNKLLGYEEQRLTELVDALSKKIETMKPGKLGAKGEKFPEASLTETIVFAERLILKHTNDLADKTRLLQSILDARSIGKRLVSRALTTGDFAKIAKIAPALAKIIRSKSDDPVVQKAIDDQLERVKKFAANADIDDPYTFYFPFIRKDKLEKFLNGMRSRDIRVGSESYRREFKNILTNENLELNPVKAYYTVEKQQVIDRRSRDFLAGFVKKYGKSLESFKSSDEAIAAGYKVVKDKGMFGKEVGYVSTYDSMLLSNLITPEFMSISMLAKATGFDAYTNLFKRSVTGLFLPFHMRNFVSGMIQNFEVLGVGALNPKAIVAGQKMAYRIAMGRGGGAGTMQVAGRTEKVARVFDAFAARYGSDTFYQNDFLQAADVGKELAAAAPVFGKQALLSTVKTVGLGSTATPFRLARVAGQFIEHQQKATAYIVALGQGKTIPQALKVAEKAGFDYRALTSFESQVMRRIIPFYSFTRKNIQLQLETLGESPQRINQVLAFFENLGEEPTTEEKQSLPGYLANSIGIKLDDLPNGIKQYIAGFGTPIEQFAGLVNGNPILLAISMTNPIIKAPVEIGIGKDSFRQKDLKDVYDAREYSAAPQVIKDLLEIHEVQKDVLSKNVYGKLVKTGERTVYMADPTKLLIARSLFTSRGFGYLDQIFDGEMTGFVKWVKLTTGIKPQQIDIQLSASLKERDQRRALEDIIIKSGGAAMYSRLYVPKGRE